MNWKMDALIEVHESGFKKMILQKECWVYIFICLKTSFRRAVLDGYFFIEKYGES